MDKKELITGKRLKEKLEKAIDRGSGLLRLMPAWVPRSFLVPGGRLRLHPDDIYAYGKERGGIDERWLASTTDADNEEKGLFEGLSVCKIAEAFFLLRDAIDVLGEKIIGSELYSKYGRWPVLCKFFDNKKPIPLHIHHPEKNAKAIGKEPKPESYYFPHEYNPHLGDYPRTYFGLRKGVTRDQVRRRLESWESADNGMLNLSRAYELETGTGWSVPPGVLHAPGTLCTYEVQWGSDVFSMFQNNMGEKKLDRSLLAKDVPKDSDDEIEFLLDMIDWDVNTDPDLKEHYYRAPVVANRGGGWEDRWVVYGNFNGKQLFSAKELRVEPGCKCSIADPGPSGWITVQGEGKIESMRIKEAEEVKFGDITQDELFITHESAMRGLEIENTGTIPLVALRYFGPDTHDDMPS